MKLGPKLHKEIDSFNSAILSKLMETESSIYQQQKDAHGHVVIGVCHEGEDPTLKCHGYLKRIIEVASEVEQQENV